MPKHQKVSDEQLVRMIYDEVVQVRTESFDLISDQRIDSNYSFSNQITSTTQPMNRMSKVKFYFTPSVVQTLVMHQSKIFCSDKETVEFMPMSYSEDAQMMAKQLGMMVNHVLHRENAGFDIITELFRSAAVNKNGVAKVTWDESLEIFEETYEGVDEATMEQVVAQWEAEGYDVDVKKPENVVEEATALAQIDEITGEEIYAESMMKYGDYTVRLQRKNPKINIDVLPPEEFLINEDTTNIHNDHLTRFVGHKREVIRGDIAMMLDGWGVKGIDVDSLSDYESLDDAYEKRARHDVDGTLESYQETEVQSGPSSKIVLNESWIRADRDGDGYPEWRHVFTVGSTLLMDEEWFGPVPFTSYTFFPIPHKFYGLSVYDRLRSYEETATGLIRSDVDRARMQNTLRWFVKEGGVDIRQLESGRPGPIEYSNTVKPREDIVPLETPGGSSNTIQILEELRKQVIGEVGIDPISGQVSTDIQKSGNDADKTAMTIDNASVKMEGFSRRFAEGPLRDISWAIAMELVRHKDTEYVKQIVEAISPGIPFLAGEMNFSTMIRKADLKSKVGLGHQTGPQKIAASQAVMQMMQQLIASPNPAMYFLIAETLKGHGYEQPEGIIGDLQYWEQKEQEAIQAQAALQQQAETQLQMDADKNQAQVQLEYQRFEFDKQMKYAETMAKIGEIEAKTGKTMEEARKIAMETRVAGSVSPSEVKVVL